MTERTKRSRPTERKQLETIELDELDCAAGGVNWRRWGSVAGQAAMTLLTTPGVAM